MIHADIVATGPTRSGAFETEAPTGPLMIQGSHGPIALRALRCRVPSPAASPTAESAAPRNPPKPILVKAGETVRVQRGFVPFQPSKRLYACSVATPSGLHYAYDLESCALIRVWRGEFLDTTEMWDGRGGSQVAKPAGPGVMLSSRPGIAWMESPDVDGWPATTDALYASEGYSLERDGTPVFKAVLSNLRITDRFTPSTDGKALTRTLLCQGSLTGWATFVLLAEAETIVAAPGKEKGYIIGDREWYLDWPADSAHTPRILSHGGRQFLVVPLTKATFEQPVAYTLVW